jgi:hypothetical protein
MNQKPILTLFVSFFLLSVVHAQEIKKDSLSNKSTKPVRSYTTTRLTTAKPIIDGVLNDDCWKTGEWAGDWTQWIPNEGAKPSQPTELKILYDDKNLYVALRAFDNEPSKISRKAGRRDELTGDMVGVVFDSYHDRRTGFEFIVTAAGQKVDDILTNPMVNDLNWNAVWYVKTGLEDSAWVAEFEIPLSQLRYSSDPEQVWGLHAWRWIDRLSEESDWELQTSTGPGILYQFGELQGIQDIPKSQRIEIMPYALGKLKTFEKQPGNPYAENGHTFMGSAGLDAKIGLSSNFTADLTINPDFGQVESDPSVMNLTAFETFYEEKRPFFLEGENIFKFELDDDNVFYTRRIGHAPDYKPELGNDEYLKYPDNTSILSAVKVSGKSAKGLSVGVLQSMTANETALLYSGGNEQEIDVEPLTSYTVGRVQQDFNQGTSTLGGIITSTNRFINSPALDSLNNRNAFTAGMDFLHQWNDQEFYLDAKLIASSINGSTDAISDLQLSSARYYQRPDATHLEYDPMLTQLNGQGGTVKIGKGSKGLWRYSAEVNWKSPGLDLNDIGYMQMADQVKEETEISYFVNHPVSVFRTYTVGIHQQNNWDYALNYLNSGLFLTGSMEFLSKWKVAPSVFFRTESLDTRLLRGGNAILLPAMMESTLAINSDVSKKIFGSLSGIYTGAQEDNYKNSRLEASLTVIPFNVLKLTAGAYYTNNMDELQYVETKSLNGNNKYIMGLINQNTLGATFRIDYNITPELSLQYYGSPFASVGKYSELKEITEPQAESYTDRFSILQTSYSEADNSYHVSAKGDEPAYSIANPDFTFSQFRSNLVFRWEYRPGSQLYFVWANERTFQNNGTHTSAGDAMGKLGDAYPNNIFQVKLSYWFSL